MASPEAVLFCDHEKAFTGHCFDGVTPISAEAKEEGYNIIYQCSSCGEERIWGNTEYLSLELKKAIKKLKN